MDKNYFIIIYEEIENLNQNWNIYQYLKYYFLKIIEDYEENKSRAIKVGDNIKKLKRHTFTKKGKRKGDQVDKIDRYIQNVLADLDYLIN